MQFNRKEIEIWYGKSHIEFNGKLIVTLHQYSSNIVSVTIGSTGFENHYFELRLGESKTVNFDNPYEIRVLEFNSNKTIFLLTELPLNAHQNTLLIESSLFSEVSAQDTFTEDEINTLKEQINSLRLKVEDLFELNEEQSSYIKASFDMLSKKLDDGAKASWRQAAYGVMTSVACSIPSNMTQVGQFYDLVRETFRYASKLLGQ